MAEPDDPESTEAYPDQVETVDVLGPTGRAARERTPPPASPPTAPLAARDERVEIGRYRLLEMVGAGGMGMVWGAWDPELERRVALKLVKYSSAGSRERMLQEGQALARLSHPNVVAIYDVGVMGDQVYLVMEWVRGQTLRAHRFADAREVLAAYRQAGEGLAAAHHAGVIHRDFKPDNTIRGDDGRVRVLDFGLAHDEDRAPPSPDAGTPRYMPPEQARGELVTAAGDQYAFCVSLREALEATGGVPPWIAAIVERGTAPDAADRFASLDDVLAALARDPARRRRRLALAAVALAGAVGAFAIGRARGTTEVAAIEPCSGGAAELAPSWSAAIRERVADHLRGLGAINNAELTTRELDAYAAGWIDQRRRTCLAHEAHMLPETLHEGRLVCLARARSQLAAVGEVLAATTEPGLADAQRAARSLPDVRGCDDDAGLAPPPLAMRERVQAIAPRIERALVLAAARKTEARALAKQATADARATGYLPLIARALLVEGRARLVDRAIAADVFAEAMQVALRAGDDVTAVEAYARWIYDRSANGASAIDHWPVMVELAERLGRAGRTARALMYNSRGVAYRAIDDVANARRMFERARAAAGDAPDAELVVIAQNLGQVAPDPETALARYVAARDRLRATLGAHPDTYAASMQVAALTPRLVDARAELDTACRGFAAWHLAGYAAECAYEAGWLADEDGDRDGAVAWFSRARDIGYASQVAEAYAPVVRDAGRAGALADLERLIAGIDRKRFWLRVVAVDALVVVARIDPRAWSRALTLAETLAQLPTYARRLARIRRMVARRAKPDEASRLAAQALPWYTRGDPAIARELQSLTAAGGSSR